MQSAREPGLGRGRADSAPRAPATNRTLVWFSAEAEQRRRTAAAAQEVSSRRADTRIGGSYDEIRRRAQALRAGYLTALFRRGIAWLGALPRHAAVPASGVVRNLAGARAAVGQRTEVLGGAALAALALALFQVPALNVEGTRRCRTEPLVLAPGADLDVKMTVSHNAACAIWAKPRSITVNDMTITKAPLHGTLARRGRTGVIYRPADRSGGEDFFAFAIRRTEDTRDQVSLFRVHVTIN
jgi:hypothetical protein